MSKYSRKECNDLYYRVKKASSIALGKHVLEVKDKDCIKFLNITRARFLNWRQGRTRKVHDFILEYLEEWEENKKEA